MEDNGFDINIIDEDYYKFPIFPVEENNRNASSLLGKIFRIVSNINWDQIYDQNRISGDLFLDSRLNKELLEYTNIELNQMDSIDKQVELILKLESKKGDEKRAKELKKWLIKYFSKQNKINFPKFSNIVVLRLAYLILISILIKIFPEGIWFKSKELQELLKQEDRIKLFLPSHKSHLDYMIVHIMCIRMMESVPTVIAGENLNVKFFGNVLATVGAAYIKRNWFNYTDILMNNYSNFFKFILRKRINIELFIEGGRSRDGKLLIPKFGILKLIFDNVVKEQVPTVALPLSISYEKIYEFDSITNELIGKPKRKESFRNILRNGIVNFRQPKNFGKIFVNFAPPIDLLSYTEDCSELGIEVMDRINQVSYITNISVINTAMYLLYYRQSKRLQLQDILKEVLFLLDNIDREQANLKRMQSLSKSELHELIIHQCTKFNRHCIVEGDEILIDNITDFIIHKNNLIHLFISKSLIAKVALQENFNHFELDLERLKHIFKSQFIPIYRFNVSKELEQLGVELNLESVRRNSETLKWFSKFIDPFIDSYLLFGNLLLKDKDLILSNLAKTVPSFVESKNKFYYFNFLKLLSETKIYSPGEEQLNLHLLINLITFISKFNRKQQKL